MRRPRLRIWTLILLVLAFALAFGGWSLKERARTHRNHANYYKAMEFAVLDYGQRMQEMADIEEKHLENLTTVQGKKSALLTKSYSPRYEDIARQREKVRAAQREAEFYAYLMRKHNRVARRPWLSYPRDPPNPYADKWKLPPAPVPRRDWPD